ncbi:MAG: PEP-CTERM sorting domain-containing protein [Planctomycetota bacterium]
MTNRHFARSLFVALPLAVLATNASAAVIASQGFDTETGGTWAFTSNVPETNQSADVWDEEASRGVITAPSAGAQFWSGTDLGGVNNRIASPQTEFYLDFAAIDISNFVDVTVTFDFWADRLDPDEDVFYQIDTGAGLGAKVFVFEPGAFNQSTGEWTGVGPIVIPDTATTVALRIGIEDADDVGNNDQIGFDEVVLSGTAGGGDVVIPEPASLAMLACGGLMMMSRRRRA